MKGLVIWASVVILLGGCDSSEEDAQMDALINSGDVAAMVVRIRSGELISAELTAAYLARIDSLDAHLNAVLALNPNAMADAKARDSQADKSGVLFGIPVLVKDNIETKETATTAGYLALKDHLTNRDAELIATLRASGAVILGKANLSEWANFRSSRSSSGWSAVGGQTRNPWDLSRSPCGSSAGSGAAVAARLAPVAIGTETNGSIVCPANVNGVVGFKPSVGQLSQKGIVPISHSQDTAGPMAVDVMSAALLFDAMSGNTALAGSLGNLDLKGKRLGVVRTPTLRHEGVSRVFTQTLEQLEDAGAVLVPELQLNAAYDGFRADTLAVLLHEFKDGLNRYLASLPGDDTTQTLASLIAFNEANRETEMRYFQQEMFVRAQQTTDLNDDTYQEALTRVHQATRQDGIDKLMHDHHLDALIAPTGGPAWTIDLVLGDHGVGGFSTFPAVSGYPHVTLPMGQVHGLPVGLSIVAGMNEDKTVLQLAYAVERLLDSGNMPAMEFAQ